MLYDEANNFSLRIWCYLAQISSPCLNPAIYSFISSVFRKLVFEFCCCCFMRRVFNRRCCHGHANQVQPTMWKRTTPGRAHHVRRIWKRSRFHSENASNITDITRLSFMKPPYSKRFRPHKNYKPASSDHSSLESGFENFRFCDGLVWTVSLKLRFKISPAH